MTEPHKEVELKLGLEVPDQLDALLAVLPAPLRIERQLNHYLEDSGGHLRANRIMVRLRDSRLQSGARRVKLTVKRRTGVHGGVFVADEIEQVVDEIDWSEETPARFRLAGRAGPVVDWLAERVGRGELRVFGSMLNTRTVVEADGFVLEIDRSEFPDGSVDAEVEVETERPEAARSVVARYAALADVALFPQTLGKFARFLARCSGA